MESGPGGGWVLKCVLAAAAALAVAVGLLLPVPHEDKAEAKSQFVTLELGSG